MVGAVVLTIFQVVVVWIGAHLSVKGIYRPDKRGFRLRGKSEAICIHSWLAIHKEAIACMRGLRCQQVSSSSLSASIPVSYQQ